VPIGALARVEGDTLALTGVVASEDGRLCVRAMLMGLAGEPMSLGEMLADRLLAAGAGVILQEVRATQ